MTPTTLAQFCKNLHGQVERNVFGKVFSSKMEFQQAFNMEGLLILQNMETFPECEAAVKSSLKRKIRTKLNKSWQAYNIFIKSEMEKLRIDLSKISENYEKHMKRIDDIKQLESSQSQKIQECMKKFGSYTHVPSKGLHRELSRFVDHMNKAFHRVKAELSRKTGQRIAEFQTNVDLMVHFHTKKLDNVRSVLTDMGKLQSIHNSSKVECCLLLANIANPLLPIDVQTLYTNHFLRKVDNLYQQICCQVKSDLKGDRNVISKIKKQILTEFGIELNRLSTMQDINAFDVASLELMEEKIDKFEELCPERSQKLFREHKLDLKKEMKSAIKPALFSLENNLSKAIATKLQQRYTNKMNDFTLMNGVELCRTREEIITLHESFLSSAFEEIDKIKTQDPQQREESKFLLSEYTDEQLQSHLSRNTKLIEAAQRKFYSMIFKVDACLEKHIKTLKTIEQFLLVHESEYNSLHSNLTGENFCISEHVLSGFMVILNDWMEKKKVWAASKFCLRGPNNKRVLSIPSNTLDSRGFNSGQRANNNPENETEQSYQNSDNNYNPSRMTNNTNVHITDQTEHMKKPLYKENPNGDPSKATDHCSLKTQNEKTTTSKQGMNDLDIKSTAKSSKPNTVGRVKVSDLAKSLKRHSDCIFRNLLEFGHWLGVKEFELFVDQCKAGNLPYYNSLYKILSLWEEQMALPRVKDIVRALKKMDLFGLAEKLLKMYPDCCAFVVNG